MSRALLLALPLLGLGCSAVGGYLRDRGAIDRAGANDWGFMPPGVESVLVQPASATGGKHRLVLMSSRPRAFNAKQRAWAAALANKLGTHSEY